MKRTASTDYLDWLPDHFANQNCDLTKLVKLETTIWTDFEKAFSPPRMNDTLKFTVNAVTNWKADGQEEQTVEIIQTELIKKNFLKLRIPEIMSEIKKYYCPCCGYDTLMEEPPGTYNICKICFWEDDPVQFNDSTYKGGANRVSLILGQMNFGKYGACEKEMIKNTRKPTKSDKRNPEWKKY